MLLFSFISNAPSNHTVNDFETKLKQHHFIGRFLFSFSNINIYLTTSILFLFTFYDYLFPISQI